MVSKEKEKVEQLEMNNGGIGGNSNLPEEFRDMTPEEIEEYREIMQIEQQEAMEGFSVRPIKVKINRDLEKFILPFDDVREELRGVLVHNQEIRGYWEDDSKIPVCSSWDCIIGIETETGAEVECANCPKNQWGTATDQKGNPTRGKACTEKRRLFIELEEYDLPMMLDLPTTSIVNFDNYMSARKTAGITKLQKEIVITLSTEEKNNYDVAVAHFDIGEVVPPKKVVELYKKRKKIKEVAGREDIVRDDADVDIGDGNDGGSGDDVNDLQDVM